MTHTDDQGRLYVDDVPVYASLKGGTLHCMVRAPSREIFYQVALQVGLVEYTNPAQEAVLDEEGEIITEAVPASGDLVPIRDATIAELGEYVITPAVVDEQGNVTTPAVTDDRFHCNYYLGPSIVATGGWESWIKQWMSAGSQVAEQNKDETAIKFQGVELIDPLSIASPSNVLL